STIAGSTRCVLRDAGFAGDSERVSRDAGWPCSPHPAALRAGRPRSYMCAMSLETSPNGTRRNLVGLSRAELAAEMAGFGAEPFRARQLWHWIYHRGATDFAAMTNLAKGFRE